MARCLLYEKKLPLNFWAEAVNTASYLINRMTSRVLADKTPYELWYGFKPSIDHLKVFGSICYVLKPEVRRRKLDQKVDIGIFIGYSTTSKAYKIYDLNSNKVVVARSVKVVENATWDWKNSSDVTGNNEQQSEWDAAENIDDQPVKGTRSLLDIYSRCNVVVAEPVDVEEATNSQVWIAAMKEELAMIDKNQTWMLVDRPTHKKNVFCWNSKKQYVVAHSTAEAEYITASVVAKQLIWLRKMLSDLDCNQQNPTTLFCDNTSAIVISKNSVFHDKTKHMKIKFHAIRQFQQEGELELCYCTSEDQLANFFTKPLAKTRFEDLRARIGMTSFGTKEEC
ncbi:uncharacterized protein [Populus alba]|uniref:uncharacterized protein n=1 Tax=Populus alba TaxID=43335 RepID=UPI003CC70CF0